MQAGKQALWKSYILWAIGDSISDLVLIPFLLGSLYSVPAWPPCCVFSFAYCLFWSLLILIEKLGIARYLTNKTRKLLNKRSGTQTMNADLQVPSCVHTIQNYVCFIFGGKVYHFAMYSSWVCNRLWFWLITTKSRRTRCRILYIVLYMEGRVFLTSAAPAKRPKIMN